MKHELNRNRPVVSTTAALLFIANALQVPFADMVNHSASCHTLLCHDPEAKVLEVSLNCRV